MRISKVDHRVSIKYGLSSGIEEPCAAPMHWIEGDPEAKKIVHEVKRKASAAGKGISRYAEDYFITEIDRLLLEGRIHVSQQLTWCLGPAPTNESGFGSDGCWDFSRLTKWAHECAGFSDEADIEAFLGSVEIRNGRIIVHDSFEPDSELTSLPPNVMVNGDLIISYAEDLQELPKGLHVKGLLEMKYTGLTDLPEDLEINDGLMVDSGAPKSLLDAIERLVNKGQIRGEVEVIPS